MEIITQLTRLNKQLITLQIRVIRHREKEARTANMRLASFGVTCLNSSEVFQLGFSAGLTVLCSETRPNAKPENR
ncbi:hypothetical protein Lbys_0130 [Leadbetterella byssophila DSM 17132]|uniref:Uncharacterized protein n=1 Tax=Leadbetterella byssophila (strain DSM 17132 / JCM 16389 / KACC 11308 / NBRC 106382 / 4M15) TaxID=649349 RepID=E4RSS6_LEAB4|nr:hypothetical protein Lbys_0130 [Leadbetterella byssophila DSM 17132]